ncbi:unnamed protein product [Notodromas monacha]|uniref:Large ribosomal subunit protein eL22 n=1 Tax=Notodromas monacha TaxID=399045 RepID=A0A7R9GG67_9CRUS|nr:unnamed protein product [Notodromas monacha]CAG0919882.1 unnamed protein product [Notodromas monacha]
MVLAKAPAPKPKRHVTKKGAKGKKQKVSLKFFIDCSHPVEDGIMNAGDFEKYLTERVKIAGKTGNLSNNLVIERNKSKLTFNANVQFSKRYLKYLTKKYLKKNNLRDWLRVIASGKDSYELRYFQIDNEAEDDDEDQEGLPCVRRSRVLVSPAMANNTYQPPQYAGKPPQGLHLDVLKGDKLIQKLMIDEKKCYFFGRNPIMCDFVIDHQSCSRVHAALWWHKHLDRAFLIDLGSTHGTHIGNMRLDSNKPTPLPIDSLFHFGASTRKYIIRERPQTGQKPIMEELEQSEHAELLGLPETEMELDNLTEFNTAHNRRLAMLGLDEIEPKVKGPKKRKPGGVTFNEEEQVINPEDVDPSIGRFRNLVQSTVVPVKRTKTNSNPEGFMDTSSSPPSASMHRQQGFLSSAASLYSDLPAEQNSTPSTFGLFSSSLGSKLGISLPNPAPDVDMEVAQPKVQTTFAPKDFHPADMEDLGPKKKKYAKEAWPGRKPLSAPAPV